MNVYWNFAIWRKKITLLRCINKHIWLTILVLCQVWRHLVAVWEWDWRLCTKFHKRLRLLPKTRLGQWESHMEPWLCSGCSSPHWVCAWRNLHTRIFHQIPCWSPMSRPSLNRLATFLQVHTHRPQLCVHDRRQLSEQRLDGQQSWILIR